MPEGDTIFRAAKTLRSVLEARSITRFEAPRVPGRHPAAGTAVEEVRARGKHLLIRFGGGVTLHTHMQMVGSWHIYRHGEGWRKGVHRARVIIETSEIVCVCFDAPTVELLEPAELARHPQLSSLGPDLCSADADLDLAVRRMRALDGSTPIGVALLDQRVAAGIGNVYKSEVLHACRTDPFVAIDRLSDAEFRELLRTASRLLRSNLDGRKRTTVAGGLAVYERAGRPCRTCRSIIKVRRQGDAARSTWWCPTCQPPARGVGPDAGDHHVRAV